ncbi:hypothetical protein L7F22_021759 [Adiantum nelumboides]|nr:hypothetical protein [Adiantum nelumboides]
MESIHWSKAFPLTLVEELSRQAYFLSGRGICVVNDVVDSDGNVLTFDLGARRFGLGMHYRQLWSQVQVMLSNFLPILPLNEEHRSLDWRIQKLYLDQISARQVYKVVLPNPWLADQCNALCHFVLNLTIGAPVIQSLRKHTDAFLDCHLMVSNPFDYVGPFAQAGASGFTFHVEMIGRIF